MVIFNIRKADEKFDSALQYTDELNDEMVNQERHSVEYPKALNAFGETVHDDHYKDRYDFSDDHDYGEELIFLINTAEQCKRPTDMLKFIGYYFKCSILQSDSVFTNKASKDDEKGLTT